MSLQPRSNFVKDESGNLLIVSHKMFNRWKNYFSQMLNVHRVGDVRQAKIHTTGPLVPEPSPFDVAKLKRFKSPDIYQIPA